MAAWSTEEVHTLVGVWGAADVQRQLDGVTRKKKIYQEIATSHNAYGYDRTWEQCRVKVKNLVQKYKQVSAHVPNYVQFDHFYSLGEGQKWCHG